MSNHTPKPLTGQIAPKPARLHLANFAKALNCFKPVLVNEKWTGEYEAVDGKEVLDQHQFINLAFGAMQDVSSFMQDHEKLKRLYTELADDARSAYEIAKAGGVNCDTLENTIVAFASRRNQLKNIVETFINSDQTNLAKLKEAARQYLYGIVPAQDGTQPAPPFTTVPEPEADGGGTNGENQGKY